MTDRWEVKVAQSGQSGRGSGGHHPSETGTPRVQAIDRWLEGRRHPSPEASTSGRRPGVQPVRCETGGLAVRLENAHLLRTHAQPTVPLLTSTRRPRKTLPAGALGRGSVPKLLLAGALASCSGSGSPAPAPPGRATPPPAAPAQRRDATVYAVFNDVLHDSVLQGERISVTARDSTLVLKGSVRDEAGHRRLLEIAGRHAGRFAVADSVKVGTGAPADSAPGSPDGRGAEG
jgi:hypothetical protein